jgi:hypothetical protein
VTLTPEAIDTALKAWGFFHPEDASFLAFLRAHEGTISQLTVIEDDAIAEGPAALEAVRKAAPKLYAAVMEMAGELPLKGLVPHPTPVNGRPDIVPGIG